MDHDFGDSPRDDYILSIRGEPINTIYALVRSVSLAEFNVEPGAMPPTLSSPGAEFRFKQGTIKSSEEEFLEVFARAIEGSVIDQRGDAPQVGSSQVQRIEAELLRLENELQRLTSMKLSYSGTEIADLQSRIGFLRERLAKATTGTLGPTAPTQQTTILCSSCKTNVSAIECDRCHNNFCFEHANPYTHQCAGLESGEGTSEYPTERPYSAPKRSRRGLRIAAVAVLLLIVGAAGYGYYHSLGAPATTGGSRTNSISTSAVQYPTSSITSSSATISTSAPSTASSTVASASTETVTPNPSFTNGKANVSYPSDYNALAQYALNMINQDRVGFGLQTVALSTVPSGQQHADSMLYFGYFSHWDTQGYKPYMRFTLLGGEGSVAENIDHQGGPCPAGYLCPWEFTSQDSVESAIADAEHYMVYNDSYCCNNGHRAEILNPTNNRVSIGVAWNATDFFFVEDFVDTHANFSTLSYDPNSRIVTLSGFSQTTLNTTQAEIAVFYDPVPTSLSPLALDPNYHRGGNYSPFLPACDPFFKAFAGYVFYNDGCTDYQGGYGSGYSLGITVYKQPCPQGNACTYPTETSDSEIQSYATVWQMTAISFMIQFPLGTYTQYFGNGVYTIYFLPNYRTNETLTTYSIFVGS